MKKALQKLGGKVASFDDPSDVTDEEVEDFLDNTVVALMVGGEGQRFSEVDGAKDVHKTSYKLPNGDTMVEMAIRMYRDAGVTSFVGLIYHQADTVTELLGDGSSLGVNIKYSADPGKQVGRGGAVLNAWQNGSIKQNANLIVHNPDDVIVRYPGSFPEDIVRGHINGRRKGRIATVVVVDGTEVYFSRMKVEDGCVVEIEYQPFVPLPTHIGVTLFSPDSRDVFEEKINLDQKMDFEKELFPDWSQEKRLHAVKIPYASWLPVNDAKTLSKLVTILEES